MRTIRNPKHVADGPLPEQDTIRPLQNYEFLQKEGGSVCFLKYHFLITRGIIRKFPI